MKRNFTFLSPLKTLRNLAFLFIAGTLFPMTLRAANFEVDTTNLLPDGDITADMIIYAKISPVNDGIETDSLINGGFALSEYSVTAWADYSVYVRFANTDNKKPYIDVRSEGANPNMVALDTIYFEMNQEYEVWIEIHFADKKYDVYIKAPGADYPVKIAEGAAFRHIPTSALSYFNCMHNGDYPSHAHVNVLDIGTVDNIPVQTGIRPQIDRTLELCNYPNPFVSSTFVRYHLNNTSSVSLKIFDIRGKEVRNLVNERQPAGDYEISVERANLSTGIYFCKLVADNKMYTQKMVVK